MMLLRYLPVFHLCDVVIEAALDGVLHKFEVVVNVEVVVVPSKYCNKAEDGERNKEEGGCPA